MSKVTGTIDWEATGLDEILSDIFDELGLSYTDWQNNNPDYMTYDLSQLLASLPEDVKAVIYEGDLRLSELVGGGG